MTKELTKRIPLSERYTLCIDAYSMWVEELKKWKDKHGEEKETWSRCAGYCGTYEGLIVSFAKQKARDVEAETVRELLEEMKQIQEETIKLATDIVRKGKNETRHTDNRPKSFEAIT